jgi:hypothetical protein
MGFVHLVDGHGQCLVFMLDHPALRSDVDLAITVDIPKSICIPEVRLMPGGLTMIVSRPFNISFTFSVPKPCWTS